MTTKINTDKLLNVDDLTESITIKADQYQGLYSAKQTTYQLAYNYDYKINGVDLVVTVDINKQITVLDYFLKNGKAAFNILAGSDYKSDGVYYDMIADGVVDNSNAITANTLLYDNINVNTLDVKYPSTVTGTAFNDTIDLSDVVGVSKGFNINAGLGDDRITGTKYDDTITGGAGENTILVDFDNGDFGNDTYKFTSGEGLNIRTQNESTNDNYRFDIAENGKDVIFVAYNGDHVYGTITLEGLAQKDITGESDGYGVRINGGAVYFDFDDESVENNSLTTTALGDVVNLENFSDENEKGVTIKTGTGSDVIVGSKYDDTITGGTQQNYITVDFKNGTFGDDTINLTQGESLIIRVKDNNTETSSVSDDQIETYVDGNDVKIDAYAKAYLDYDKDTYEYTTDAAKKYYTQEIVDGTSIQTEIVHLKNLTINNGEIVSGSYVNASGNTVALNSASINNLNNKYEDDFSSGAKEARVVAYINGLDIEVPSSHSIIEQTSGTYTSDVVAGTYYVSDKTINEWKQNTETTEYGWVHKATEKAYNTSGSGSTTVIATLKDNGGVARQVEAVYDENGKPTDYTTDYYLQTWTHSEYAHAESTVTTAKWAAEDPNYSAKTTKVDDYTLYTKYVKNAVTGNDATIKLTSEPTAEELYYQDSISESDYKIDNNAITQMGTMTVKDAAKAGVLNDNTSLRLKLNDSHATTIFYNERSFNEELTEKTAKGVRYVTGTNLGDNIDYSAVPVTAEGVGYNINAGNGNDYIEGSKGDDTITAGTGRNTVYYATNKVFGDDVVKVTKGEITNVDINNDYIDGQIVYTREGNNIKATVYGATTYGYAHIKFTSKNTDETTGVTTYTGKISYNNDYTASDYSYSSSVAYAIDTDYYGEIQLKSDGTFDFTTFYANRDNENKYSDNYTKIGRVAGNPIIDTTLGENGKLGTITFENAIKKDNTGINGISVNDVSLKELAEQVVITGKNAKFTGTWVDDNITVGNVTKSVTINAGEGDNYVNLRTSTVKTTVTAGAGDDIVVTGKGNDNIKLGKGDNSIYIDASNKFGSDTLTIDKDSFNRIVFSNDILGQIDYSFNLEKHTFTITVYGQENGVVDTDVVYGKVTVKGVPNELLTLSNLGATIEGDKIIQTNIRDLMYTEYLDNKHTKFQASYRTNDNIVATSGTTKALNVHLGAGWNIADLSLSSGANKIISSNDSINTVIGGSGNDTYSMRAGTNNIIIDNFDDSDGDFQKFGNDVVNLTKDQNVNVTFEDASRLYYDVVGKDVVVSNVLADTSTYDAAYKVGFTNEGYVTYTKTITTYERTGTKGNYTYTKYETTYRTTEGFDGNIAWKQEGDSVSWNASEELYNDYVSAVKNAKSGNLTKLTDYYTISKYTNDTLTSEVSDSAEKVKYIKEGAYYNIEDTCKYDYLSDATAVGYAWNDNQSKYYADTITSGQHHVYLEQNTPQYAQYIYVINGLATSGWTERSSGYNGVKTAYTVSSSTEYAEKESFNNVGSITFKNFAAKDVVGENGSVVVNGVDLSDYMYDSGLWKDKYDTTKSFTGTRLNEIVDASEYTLTGATPAAKGVTINAGGGHNIITGSQYTDTITAGSGVDYVTATTGDDTYTLGQGNNHIVYGANQFGDDVINLTNGEDLSLRVNGTLTYERLGNDIKITSKDGDNTYGTITLKNLAKGTTGANVYVNGSSIWENAIDYAATSTKKNTFVQTYDSDYEFGNISITSKAGAKDTIQISAANKSLGKMTAYDFDFNITDNETKVYADSRYDTYTNTITYETESSNIKNLTFKDAAGTAWKIVHYEDKDKYILDSKNNEIAFVDGDLYIVDSKKNNIVYGDSSSQTYNYTSGKDVYLGGEGTDNYQTAINKNTTLVISEYNGTNETNVLRLTNDIDNATLFFNVDKNGDIVGDNTELAILNRASYLKGTAASALVSDGELNEFAKGSIILRDFFEAGGNTTSQGEGYISKMYENYGNTKLQSEVDLKALINQTAQEVAGWLSDHQNYADAYDVIEAGDKADIQSLMNVYNTANYQS